MNRIRDAAALAITLAAVHAYAGPTPSAEPIDPDLTAETRSLHAALQAMTAAPTIQFGQHLADWASAVQNTGQVVISDWEATAGSRPAFHEWDWIVALNGSAGNYTTNFAAVNRIRQQYEEGAFIGFCWHLPNPALEGQPGNNYDRHDDEPAVPRLLPGGDLHDHYVDNYLDPFADMLEQLHADGTPIPIIMRPYHEPGFLQVNGSGQATAGFWWNWSSPEEYMALWRMTVEYFRDTRNLHNLLWAYSPNWPSSQNYYDRWYQADYVDICGGDQYRSPFDQNPEFSTPLSYAITRGQADGKIVAYTEMGAQGLAQAGGAGNDWWHGRVYAELAPSASDVAYALTWANWGADQFYIPPPNAPAAARADFNAFLATDEINHFAEMRAEFGDIYATVARCSSSDIAEPIGVADAFDAIEYARRFGAGCDGGTDSPIDQSDLLGFQTAWLGSVNSVSPDGNDAVLVSVTASSEGFVAIQSTRAVSASGFAALGLFVEPVSQSFSSGVLFAQTGPGWVWHEGPVAGVATAVENALSIDPQTLAHPSDVRGWGVQLYGANAFQNATLRISPLTEPAQCGAADVAAPIGVLDGDDVNAFMAELLAGCQ